MYRYIKFFVTVFTIVIISGCATIPLIANRYNNAEEIAQSARFERSYIKSDNFTLTVYSRIENPGNPIVIYVEGDGFAYRDRFRVSIDPTPTDPVAMRLAATDPSSNIAYIARPGQYCRGEIPDCDESYWTTRRFSEEVIRSIDGVVSEIKNNANSSKLDLVGFSGGGAVVCLVAARRNDVASIRTVAGNLDPDAVNAFHKVSKLEGALNPMETAPRLADIPQRHFVGGRDKIIPLSVTYGFAEKSGDIKYNTVTLIPDAGHKGPWTERWKELLKLSLIKPSDNS